MTKKPLIFLLLFNSMAFAQQKPPQADYTSIHESTRGNKQSDVSGKQMTLQECEEAFVSKNLSLLAQQYDISQAEADVIQAKIWDLPQLQLSANAYDPQNKKAFHIGQSKEASVSQLIYLGGKKKNEVEFAKSNVELAKLQFSQLLASLRAQLRTTFYALYFEQHKLADIKIQLDYLNNLLAAYKEQGKKGNVSLKDQVRLQTMAIDLNNEKTTAINNSINLQQQLRVLISSQEDVLPKLTDREADQELAVKPTMALDKIYQLALENNADYQFALKTSESSQLFTKWQQSLNTPDINLGLSYSQNGGVFRNELNVTAGIPIPLWKQNKGNVIKAKYAEEEAKKNIEVQRQLLESQIRSNYQSWENQYNQYFTITPDDLHNIAVVYDGIFNNFKKGNISLVEFTDFMDSYRISILKLYDMKKEIILNAEQLNYLAQTSIFNSTHVN
ncbi:TolC family protein [Sphingobacterium siyangense]|uniref:TolC family protein n=1 Tax=Sphingobacterium siyangense TaxID=459529 RepID=UPI0031FA46CA